MIKRLEVLSFLKITDVIANGSVVVSAPPRGGRYYMSKGLSTLNPTPPPSSRSCFKMNDRPNYAYAL